MNIKRSGIAALALLAAGALTLTGCTSDSAGGESDNSAIITTNGVEPEHGLVPTNTNEVGGGKILDEIFAGLYYYDEKGAPQPDLADSVESSDAQHYTIKIKSGRTFTNGEKVSAKSFVDAWKYGALAANEQLNSSWFSDIEGYDTLTGLKVVDDTTFTVDLKHPVSDFPLRLGYSAFYPLPEAAYKDMKAFGENPIGNGPYKLAKTGAWQHNVKIELVTNDSYDGPRKAQNGGLNITFYAQEDAAYADLQSGNLDVLDAIPASAIATFQKDLGDRAINQPAAVFQSFTIPERLAHFAGEEGKLRRAAISHAINREEITKVIFEGTRTPANDFTSPVISGWSDKTNGSDVLKFDAAEAKKLWAQADAMAPWSGTFEIAYNSDSSHQVWVDAVSNSIKNTLGIDAKGAPLPTFPELRTAVNNRSIQTAFRTGWQGDYPGMTNFLEPLYVTSASSNDGDYSNPEFDRLMSEAAADPDQSSSIKKLQDAQSILFQDLPAIPLWYANVTGGYGTNVSNVKFGWNSVPLYYEITKK